MTVDSQPSPLIEAIVKHLKLPWYVVTIIFAIFLLLMLVLVAYLDGDLTSEFEWNYWRIGIQRPVLIIYILTIYPVISTMGNNVIKSLQPLLIQDNESVKQFISGHSIPSRRGELISLAIGGVLILLLTQPWRGYLQWLEIYLVVIEMALFGLLASLIYSGLHNARYVAKLNQNINLDIFDIDALAPVARWSLAVSLAFVGGIVISIIFQTAENLMQWPIIVIYVILVGATIAIFFISMSSTHNAISRVKKSELAFVTEKLTEVSRDLKQKANKSADENTRELYYAIAAWGLYERRIREVKEWPLNAGIISRLVLSAVSPGVIYLIKVLLGIVIGL
jgi:hypothetical protein